LASAVYFYHYRNQIGARLVSELSKKLPYPIQVKQVGISVLDSFPKLSLVFYEVAIPNTGRDTSPWLKASKVYCAFDIRSFLRGQYVIDRLSLEHGFVNWAANQPHPFQLKETKQKKPSSQRDAFRISLNTILLKDMELVYSNQQEHQRYVLQAESVKARLSLNQEALETELDGKVLLHQVAYRGGVWQKEIPFLFQGKLGYNYAKKLFTLHQVQLQQDLGTLAIEGNWGNWAYDILDLKIKGQQLAMQKLLSYLPTDYDAYLKSVQVQGNLGFDVQLSRKSGKYSKIGVQGTLALSESQVMHKRLPSPIKLGQVQGQLHLPDITNLATGVLHLEEQTISLGDSKLVGKLSIENMQDLYLQYPSKVSLNLASLSQLFPLLNLKDADGWLVGDWKFEGNLRQLLNRTIPYQTCKLNGQFNTQGVYFSLNQLPCELQDQTSSFLLSDDGLMVKNLLGRLGSGNFALQGTLKNLTAFLLAGRVPLLVDAKLYADYLDIDALLSDSVGSANQPIEKSKFNIAPYWVGQLTCDIQELRYKHFHGKQVQGRLQVKDQKLTGENLVLGLAGGKATLNGFVDAHTDSLHVYTLVKLQGVQIDKLFYSFNNFQQQFLKDEHLGGSIFADLVLNIQTNKQWQVNWDSLTADMAIQVHDGMLRNFAPLQKLSEYVAEEHLTYLRFSALKNNIQVKNKTIYIPPMDIYSNITRIQLSGTHTFDGKLAYNLVIPLANFKQKGMLPEIETVGEESLAGLNLHLKLTGDTKNYKLSYDTEALKASLKANFDKQGQALKAILQGQYTEKKKVKELATDEYFDFD
jgi:hypothetical protein